MFQRATIFRGSSNIDNIRPTLMYLWEVLHQRSINSSIASQTLGKSAVLRPEKYVEYMTETTKPHKTTQKTLLCKTKRVHYYATTKLLNYKLRVPSLEKFGTDRSNSC